MKVMKLDNNKYFNVKCCNVNLRPYQSKFIILLDVIYY